MACPPVRLVRESKGTPPAPACQPLAERKSGCAIIKEL